MMIKTTTTKAATTKTTTTKTTITNTTTTKTTVKKNVGFFGFCGIGANSVALLSAHFVNSNGLPYAVFLPQTAQSLLQIA